MLKSFIKIRNFFFNTSAKRIAKLEKAIRQAIDKYDIKLADGIYLELNHRDDICGCAIGSAILSTAKNKQEVDKLINQFEAISGNELAETALRIINNGITKQELIDLEAGFEGWSKGDAVHNYGIFNTNDKIVNFTSPFYQAGQRLRRERYYRND